MWRLKNFLPTYSSSELESGVDHEVASFIGQMEGPATWLSVPGMIGLLLVMVTGFFLEMSFRGGNCFCGERKCEKYPAGHKFVSVWGGNFKLVGGNFPSPEKNTGW